VTGTTRRAARHALGLLVALALLSATAGCSLGGGGTRHVTAHFSRAVGVYVKSDVRILGVSVGRVTAIKPEGSTVRVDMEYDSKYKIPADAKALVVAPSIVSDRYVQFTPAYTAGPVLADGSTLDVDRTAVPLELDEVYADIDKLNQALGPNGANKNGALSDLLKVSAQNLNGNGQQLGTTLADFSKAVQTLSENRDDLFSTIANLQQFTTTIANSDQTVRDFNNNLAQVAGELAGERQDLATAIKQLSLALGEVSTFVHDNRDSLTSNVAGLAEVTKVLVDQKTALKEFIDTAPTALSNLQLAYNPASGTLDTRDNGASQTLANGLPLGLVCPVVAQATTGLNAVLSQLPQLAPAASQLQSQCQALAAAGGSTPAAPASPATSSSASLPSALVLPGGSAAAAPATAAPTDLSLAGLLMGAS
jgi:virulence factor Mce-like protein